MRTAKSLDIKILLFAMITFLLILVRPAHAFEIPEEQKSLQEQDGVRVVKVVHENGKISVLVNHESQGEGWVPLVIDEFVFHEVSQREIDLKVAVLKIERNQKNVTLMGGSATGIYAALRSSPAPISRVAVAVDVGLKVGVLASGVLGLAAAENMINNISDSITIASFGEKGWWTDRVPRSVSMSIASGSKTHVLTNDEMRPIYISGLE